MKTVNTGSDKVRLNVRYFEPGIVEFWAVSQRAFSAPVLSLLLWTFSLKENRNHNQLDRKYLNEMLKANPLVVIYTVKTFRMYFVLV